MEPNTVQYSRGAEASLPPGGAPAEGQGRNRRVVTAAAVALGVVGVLAGESLFRGAARDRQRESWGSSDALRFLPNRHPSETLSDPSFAVSDLPSYSTVLLQSRAKTQERLHRFQAVHQELLELQRTLAIDSVPASVVAQATSTVTQMKFKLEGAPTQPEVTPSELSARYRAQFGDVESLARSLFQSATGLSVPGTITITAKTMRADRSGEIHEHSGEIFYDPRDYVLALRSILHELGHAVCQLGETRALRYPFGIASSNPHIDMCEEAAAECFRVAVAQHISDPELRRAVGSLDNFLVQEHFLGRPDPSGVGFNAGLAAADAAIRVYGPSGAFRELSNAPTALPAPVLSVLAENQALTAAGASFTQHGEQISSHINGLFAEIELIERRIAAIQAARAAASTAVPLANATSDSAITSDKE